MTGHHYTYLVNGAAPDANWTGLFTRGEKVRLRFINGSSQSIFDVRIPGLKMTVVAADGQDVEPVTVDEFRIAQSRDLRRDRRADRRSRLHDLRAVDGPRRVMHGRRWRRRAGMQAEVPALDKPQWLTMVDMMGVDGHGR